MLTESQLSLFALDGITPNPTAEQIREYMQDPYKIKALHFRAAADFWLSTRKSFLKERTFYNLESHIKQLNKYFGSMVVQKIHIGHVAEYQRKRRVNDGQRWDRVAGPSIINHELIALQGVLHLASEWEKIKPFYQPLPVPPPQKPKVLTDEEEVRFFAIAAQNPDWQLALWVAYITENTSAAGSELRYMQLKHLHLDGPVPAFEVNRNTAKNNYRGRIIVLNGTALKYVKKCIERAQSLGSIHPDDYLFPLLDRNTRKYDPTKPCSSSWLRRAWDGIRSATGLHHITPHCFRHQHATVSLEAGEEPFSVARRMGHNGERMIMERYGHIRRDSQKRAVDAIDTANRLGPYKVERRGLALVR